MAVNINDLPPELLVKIFEYISLQTLSILEETCIRWSQIIIDNFYKKHLISQDFCTRKHYSFWDPGKSTSARTKQLFLTLYKELPNNWLQGRYTESPKNLVAEYSAGENGAVNSIVVFKDKIYLGIANGSVDVRDARNLEFLRTINHTPSVEQQSEFMRPCELALHGHTLAVLGADRSRVRLFNTITDEMVGEIATNLGRVYNIAIANKLLVLLSRWTIFYWKIDSMRPETVRGEYIGSMLDFEPDDNFENWLEAHEVAVNSNWLVTRASRMRLLEEGGMRITHFLNVRMVANSGYIGPVVRPSSSRLPDTVYETTCMALSEGSGNLLAVGWRVLEEGVMTIMDLKTGDRIHTIQSHHFLSSIQIPLKWENDKLFLKIIPVRGATRLDANSEPVDDFGVSLGFLDLADRRLKVIPGLVFNCSRDLIYLDRTTVYGVSTKLERLDNDSSEESHIDLNIDLESYALLMSEEENYSPVYTASLTVYDFWNVPEL